VLKASTDGACVKLAGRFVVRNNYRAKSVSVIVIVFVFVVVAHVESHGLCLGHFSDLLQAYTGTFKM